MHEMRRKRWLAGMIADARFAAAIRDLEDIELDRYPVLRFMRRAWELRANVTPYDTTYVARAGRQDRSPATPGRPHIQWRA